MNILILCFGLLVCVYVGEGSLTWIAPSHTGNGGIVALIDQTDVEATVLYTVAVTASTNITIESQTPTGVLKAKFGAADAAITLATSQNIDFETAETHVLVIIATDGTYTETATITLSVRPLYFIQPNVCVVVELGTAINSPLYTVVGLGASTISLAQNNTQFKADGYTFTPSDGTIKNDAAITTSTRPATVQVVITAVETFGTASTATSTVIICVNKHCSCTTFEISELLIGTNRIHIFA